MTAFANNTEMREFGYYTIKLSKTDKYKSMLCVGDKSVIDPIWMKHRLFRSLHQTKMSEHMKKKKHPRVLKQYAENFEEIHGWPFHAVWFLVSEYNATNLLYVPDNYRRNGKKARRSRDKAYEQFICSQVNEEKTDSQNDECRLTTSWRDVLFSIPNDPPQPVDVFFAILCASIKASML